MCNPCHKEHHEHHHEHHHGGCPHHHIPQNRKILALCLAIITSFMVVKFVGGYLFNSLALMADAGHMANDSLSLLLALVALYMSTERQRWFALVNGFSLMVVAVFILWEAIDRIQNPQIIDGLSMLGVAFLGLVVNIVVAAIMLKADHSNLNIKAAYLHVLADLFGSVVAITAGITAHFWNVMWVDTVASAILSIIILRSGWHVTSLSIRQLQNK